MKRHLVIVTGPASLAESPMALAWARDVLKFRIPTMGAEDVLLTRGQPGVEREARRLAEEYGQRWIEMRPSGVRVSSRGTETRWADGEQSLDRTSEQLVAAGRASLAAGWAVTLVAFAAPESGEDTARVVELAQRAGIVVDERWYAVRPPSKVGG